MNLFDLVEKDDVAAIVRGSWTNAELNARDGDGFTPLMRAAVKGSYKTAAALKEHGADLDLKNAEGRKAVDLAALHGHGNVMIYLIRGGCGG